ncbi:helix-hairpin-helix domain-containing protein [Streptomyces sp. NPDC057136]|uniref:helix-hairpin-helix domain-containing protein n=1 Tax=Streptomyces sp. NPDC057136 TaxID=3346029 RepID=UPI003640828C
MGVAEGGRPGWRDRAVPALRERLPLWLQLRCGLEPRTLAALGVVMVAAAILAAVHFWSGRPQAVSAPEPVKDGASAPAAPGVSLPEGSGPRPQPPAGPPPTRAAGGQIVVDVSGKVRRPGIQFLPPGSRVADALRAAGGVRGGADVTGLNRARVLTDGEQVVVGGPAGPWSTGGSGGGGPGGGGAGGGGAGTAGATGPVAPLSLSTATVEQLETLPGVGPVLAQHIVDYRAEHGGYRSVDELREVNGIGDRRFEDLQPLVRP